MPATNPASRRAGLAIGAVAAVGGAASAVASVGAAAYVARRVLTPDRRRPDDTQIFAVGDDTITMNHTVNTVDAGRYGVWLDRGEGHARVGEVVSVDHAAGRVTRRLLGVDYGRLTPSFARWNQYYFGSRPDTSLGIHSDDVLIPAEIGDLAAWRIPATDHHTGSWAVLVHGRGARREECLRAVRVLHDLGLTCLVPMYRNDIGAPPSPDGRYNLGLSEWRDVEAAMLYAVQQGARDLVLVGWSMGGAIVLQTLDRSWLSSRVRAAVLDAPVIDWTDVLRHQGALNAVPGAVGTLSRALLGRRSARRLVGVHEALDVAETNWVARAGELRHPLLLIHSEDDEFVPYGPSAALAATRPDLVRYEAWRGARHTKEWNVDPRRFNRVVAQFVSDQAIGGAGQLRPT